MVIAIWIVGNVHESAVKNESARNSDEGEVRVVLERSGAQWKRV